MFYKIKCPKCPAQFDARALFSPNNAPFTVVCQCGCQFDVKAGLVMGKWAPTIVERKAGNE